MYNVESKCRKSRQIVVDNDTLNALSLTKCLKVLGDRLGTSAALIGCMKTTNHDTWTAEANKRLESQRRHDSLIAQLERLSKGGY